MQYSICIRFEYERNSINLEEHIEAVQRMQEYIEENLTSDTGFESVDGYQRAFYREFGCNPYEYSLSPVPIYLFKPYGVKYANIRKDRAMKEVKSVFVQVIEKPARKVIIKRGKEAKDYWKYCEEVGCDVWGLLTSIKSISGEPVWSAIKKYNPQLIGYNWDTENPRIQEILLY